MITQQLLEYIKQQTQQGISPDAIKNTLRSSGWIDADIAQAFNTLTPPSVVTPPIVTPPPVVVNPTPPSIMPSAAMSQAYKPVVMAAPHKKFPVVAVIVIVLVLAAGATYAGIVITAPAPAPVATTNNPLTPPLPVSSTTENINVSTSTTSIATTTSISFPPSGWYVHNSSDIPALRTSIMLTKQKTYSKGFCEATELACYGEYIVIGVSTTTLSAETYVADKVLQQGVYPSIQKWGTLNGHKIFSMTYTTDANPVPADEEYLFVGNKVYQFSLYPSAQKNSNDFQQVVNYYATSTTL